MPKKLRTLNIKLSSEYNRAIVLTAYPNGEPIHFSVKYNKTSPALQFEVGNNTSMLNTNKISIQMHRNLDTCKFASTFFSLDNTKTERHDFRSRFIGVRSIYKNDIFKFLNERIDMNVPEDWNKVGQNLVTITGWKIHGFEDDLIYYFVQRKFFNKVMRVSVIRTAGLQFATPRGEASLDKYNQDFIDKYDGEAKQIDELNFLENIDL
jgi:hypothetical protein